MIDTWTGKTGNPEKMGDHFPVGERSGSLVRLEKSGNFTQKHLKNQEILTLENGKNTGKVQEIWQSERVGTMNGCCPCIISD